MTCDCGAVLPDELFGLPVTALGEKALSAGDYAVSGEEVLITCGAGEGEWDNHGIQSLTLPRHLKSVGQYAFLGCSALHTLTLYDEITELASSAFMNCRSFERVRLIRMGAEQGIALSAIVAPLSRRLDVTVSEGGVDAMRLIFPEYYEVFTENGPTHFFNYNIESAGFPYHNVFRSRQFSVSDYDALWGKLLATEHDADTALELAWRRLRLPGGLIADARQRYEAYLRDHARSALDLVLKERDITGLRQLMELLSPSREEISYATAKARDTHFTEAVALLLQRQHREPAAGRQRSFEL